MGRVCLYSRYYDPNTNRFISADRTDIICATPTSLTDKNLYAFCDNNPVMRRDDGGQFWDTLFDVVSLVFSVVEVIENPSDPWAWAGLVGDVVDLVPFVSGVGEATDVMRVATKVDDVVDAIDDVGDTAKAIVRYGDEVKLPKQIKTEDAIDAWNDYLGPNQTNLNKFTGKIESDRIFSADGTKSIRFGNHEMRSIGTPKAHFHYEEWIYDSQTNIVRVKNMLQRLK